MSHYTHRTINEGPKERVPVRHRIFLPVNFHGVRTTHACNRTHQHLSHVKNPTHWQPYHCLDTGKYCTHWQEWVALLLRLLCLTQVRRLAFPARDNEVLKCRYFSPCADKTWQCGWKAFVIFQREYKNLFAKWHHHHSYIHIAFRGSVSLGNQRTAKYGFIFHL